MRTSTAARPAWPRRRIIALLAIVALMLAACSSAEPGDTAEGAEQESGAAATEDTDAAADATEGDAPETEAAGGGEPEVSTLRLAQALEAPVLMPTYLGVAKGFFEEEGLDVELSTLGGGPVGVQALIGGEIEVFHGSAGHILRSMAAGAPPVDVIANTVGAVPAPITIRTEVLEDRGITLEQWEQMSYDERTQVYEGLRFGTISAGSLLGTVGKRIAAAAGLDPESDIETVIVGGAPEWTAAMQEGQVDVMLLSPPEGLRVVRDGTAVNAGPIADVAPEFQEFPWESLMVSRAFREENPNTVAAFGRAIAKACNYARDTEAEQLSQEMQDAGFFTQYEFDLLVESVAFLQESVSPNCVITQESMENLVQFEIEAGSLPADDAPDDVSEGTFWTNEYLPGT